MVLRDAEDAGQRLRTARTAFRWAGAQRHVLNASRKSRREPARVAGTRGLPVARDGAAAWFDTENSRGRQRRPCARSCSVMRRISTATGSSRGARVSSGDDGDFTPRRLVADFSVDRAHSAPATSAATTTIHNTAETRPTTSPTGGRRCGGHAGRRGRAELAPAACSWRGVVLRPACRVDDRVRYGRLGADRRRDSVTGRLVIVSAAVLVVAVAAAVWLAGRSGPEPRARPEPPRARSGRARTPSRTCCRWPTACTSGRC